MNFPCDKFEYLIVLWVWESYVINNFNTKNASGLAKNYKTKFLIGRCCRVCYCVIGRCDPDEDHSEVADSIDDYLWIKLSQIQLQPETSNQDSFTLEKLQKLLYEDFGMLRVHGTSWVVGFYMKTLEWAY